MIRVCSILVIAFATAILGAGPGSAQTATSCGPRLGGEPYPGPYNVYFDFGKAVLDRYEAAEVHRRAKQAKDIYVTRICLIGFADKVGTPGSNKELGMARARHVASIMVADGIPADHIKADTGGEAYANYNFGSYDRNKADRRVTIVFSR